GVACALVVPHRGWRSPPVESPGRQPRHRTDYSRFSIPTLHTLCKQRSPYRSGEVTYNIEEMAVTESTPIQDADLNRWLTQLRSNDVTLRSDAAHQLGKLADERAVSGLVEALADSDAYVRKSAGA